MGDNTSTSGLSSSARPPPPLCPILDDDEDYDTWVLAGGRLFRAHSSVLASHSEYLRGAAGEGGGVRVAGGDMRLLLPHVPSAGFAAILTYMYTGRLPLTPSTLYEVLLAGHVLQMASVVSLCQALLTSAGGGEGAGLGMGDVPPALSVWRGLARLVPPPHNNHTQSTGNTQTSSVIRPTPTRPRPIIHPALNPPQELHRESELMDVDTNVRDNCNNTFLPLPHRPTPTTATSTPTSNSTLGCQSGVGVVSTGAVVLDIATCDGPVFFERVVNRAYKANPLLSQDDSETETEINVDDIDSCDDQPHEHEEGEHSGSEIPGMRGILEGTSTSTASPQPLPHNQSSRTYHCVYCNHTFKSHYCYQKHMRRHINPITVEINKLKALQPKPPLEPITPGGTREVTSECGSNSNSSIGSKTGNTSPRGSLSPGLKILDLNVQYFPCKTCGSKFPSYYFVHKHRRMCHQDEERCSVTGGNKKVSPSPTVSTSPTTVSNPPPTPSTAVNTTLNPPSTSTPLSTTNSPLLAVSAPLPAISSPLSTDSTPFSVSAPPSTSQLSPSHPSTSQHSATQSSTLINPPNHPSTSQYSATYPSTSQSPPNTPSTSQTTTTLPSTSSTSPSSPTQSPFTSQHTPSYPSTSQQTSTYSSTSNISTQFPYPSTSQHSPTQSISQATFSPPNTVNAQIPIPSSTSPAPVQSNVAPIPPAHPPIPSSIPRGTSTSLPLVTTT